MNICARPPLCAPPTRLPSHLHCLLPTEVRWVLGPGSEQTGGLRGPAGPVSPSEEPSEPPAWLERLETVPPAGDTPPAHVSC